MTYHPYSPSAKEAEVGGLQQVGGHPRLYSKFQAPALQNKTVLHTTHMHTPKTSTLILKFNDLSSFLNLFTYGVCDGQRTVLLFGVPSFLSPLESKD